MLLLLLLLLLRTVPLGANSHSWMVAGPDSNTPASLAPCQCSWRYTQGPTRTSLHTYAMRQQQVTINIDGPTSRYG
jgi:hypothetical protein